MSQSVEAIIKRQMEATGTTYEQIAQKLGCSKQNVWNALNPQGRKGSQGPTYKTVRDICGAAGLELVIVPTGKTPNTSRLTGTAELGATPFYAVRKILQECGYDMIIRQKYPEKAKRDGSSTQ